MRTQLQEQIFHSLHISRESLLDEMSILLASNQLSEYKMEVDFFEKKYQRSFTEFDVLFQQQEGKLEIEDDWMAWKFAQEAKNYWQEILQQAKT